MWSSAAATPAVVLLHLCQLTLFLPWWQTGSLSVTWRWCCGDDAATGDSCFCVCTFVCLDSYVPFPLSVCWTDWASLQSVSLFPPTASAASPHSAPSPMTPPLFSTLETPRQFSSPSCRAAHPNPAVTRNKQPTVNCLLAFCRENKKKRSFWSLNTTLLATPSFKDDHTQVTSLILKGRTTAALNKIPPQSSHNYSLVRSSVPGWGVGRFELTRDDGTTGVVRQVPEFKLKNILTPSDAHMLWSF